jgi:hypothetical protein
MALAKRSLLLFFPRRASLLFFLAGIFSLSPGEAPMDGAAIFELLLALLDGWFLDLEFGESRLTVPIVRPDAAIAETAAVSAKRRDLRSAHG